MSRQSHSCNEKSQASSLVVNEARNRAIHKANIPKLFEKDFEVSVKSGKVTLSKKAAK